MTLFLVLAGSNGSVLKGPLRSHTSALLYGATAERLADETASAWGVEPSVFEAAFDTRAAVLAPSLVGVLIPGIALALALALWPVGGTAVRHVVLPTHLVSVLIALLLVLLVVLGLTFGALLRFGGDPSRLDSVDPILMPAFLVLMLGYLVVAIRRVCGIGWGGATAAGLGVGTVGLAMAFWLFRATRFAAILATVDGPA